MLQSFMELRQAHGASSQNPAHSRQCEGGHRLHTVGLVLAMLLCVQGAALAQLPPRIFFSDLVSGPNTGGENNNGAYVTLYGTNFGANPTVTVGGGQALVKLAPAPWLWYQKMTIQLGPNAETGNIVITNGSGTSNGIPFAVSPGNIYFVATTGNDKGKSRWPFGWEILRELALGGAAA
jgi:IPT/TIG domain